MKQKQQAGFSLLELMVAMGIVAILVTVGWPMFVEQGRTSNRTDAILATNAVALALTQFESDNGNFIWATPPDPVTAVNAHNRYLPMVPVGVASGTPADNICTERRGFRWVPADGRYESCRGLYSISVSIDGVADNAAGTSFIITTTAIAGREQAAIAGDPNAGDPPCQQFILDNNGAKDYNPSADLLLIEAKGVNDLHSVKKCWGSD